MSLLTFALALVFSPTSHAKVFVSPTSLAISVEVGKQVTKSLKISNQGTDPVQIRSTTTCTGLFRVIQLCNTTLYPKASCGIVMIYGPSQSESKSCKFSVRTSDAEAFEIQVLLDAN